MNLKDAHNSEKIEYFRKGNKNIYGQIHYFSAVAPTITKLPTL
jgi:hypothetical protein